MRAAHSDTEREIERQTARQRQRQPDSETEGRAGTRGHMHAWAQGLHARMFPVLTRASSVAANVVLQRPVWRGRHHAASAAQAVPAAGVGAADGARRPLLLGRWTIRRLGRASRPRGLRENGHPTAPQQRRRAFAALTNGLSCARRGAGPASGSTSRRLVSHASKYPRVARARFPPGRDTALLPAEL